MNETNSTEVLIDGKVYTISGAEDTYMQQVAAFINKKLEEIRKIIELKAEDESGNKRRLELLSAYRMKLSESLERRRKIDEHIGELEWHIRQLEGAEDSFQECPGRLCENCQYKGKCTFFRTDGEMS